jgi:hypothetical protein
MKVTSFLATASCRHVSEDGRSKHLWNVGSLLRVWTLQNPGWPSCSSAHPVVGLIMRTDRQTDINAEAKSSVFPHSPFRRRPGQYLETVQILTVHDRLHTRLYIVKLLRKCRKIKYQTTKHHRIRYLQLAKRRKISHGSTNVITGPHKSYTTATLVRIVFLFLGQWQFFLLIRRATKYLQVLFDNN